MAVTNGWGKAVENNTNGWGKYENTINAGSVYAVSHSGETVLTASGGGAFSNTKSLIFDGNDDRLSIPSYTALYGLNKFSISSWVKMPSGGGGGLMGINNTSSFNGHRFSYTLTLTSVNINVGSNAFRGTLSLNADQWYNVVFVFDRTLSPSSNKGKFFVNNTEIANTLGTNVQPMVSDTDPLTIGTIMRGTSSPIIQTAFEGSIDEVSIWTDALTTDNISAIFNSGVPNDVSALEIGSLSNFYRMGDGDEFPTINDNSGSNNGIMTNMDSGDIVEGDVPDATAGIANTKSIDFDGQDAQVLTGQTLTSLGISTEFSISFWFNSDDLGIFDTLLGAPNGNSWNSGTAFVIYNSKLRFWVSAWNTSGPPPTFVESATLSADTRYHAVGTFSTTNGLKLYINAGTPSTSSSTTITGLTNVFRLGSSESNYFFNGILDEVAVFNYELTSDAIYEIYNGNANSRRSADLNNLTNATTDPVLWYRIDGDTFPTLTDNGSGGNDGTMTNMISDDIIDNPL